MSLFRRNIPVIKLVEQYFISVFELKQHIAYACKRNKRFTFIQIPEILPTKPASIDQYHNKMVYVVYVAPPPLPRMALANSKICLSGQEEIAVW